MSTDLEKKKVAIYVRVSTAMQVDKDSLSVQKRELVVYAQMVLGIEDYEIFEDPGFSAKNTDRPAYQIMMSRLRTGEFSHLLVWKIDRISRNLLDFATMYDELKNLGVTFVSKNETFDTSSAMGEAMLKIILVFAELERSMTAERVTAVMLSRANNGQWNGGRIPFGYSYDKKDKIISVNESESRTVNLIYDLYEELQSTLQVAKRLNETGVPTRSGKDWSTTGVYDVLTNPFYIGRYTYNSHSRGRVRDVSDTSQWVVVEDHHPAIIDSARFDKIQYMLKRNVRHGRKPNDTYTRKNVHVFAGLCRCALCDGNMVAHPDRMRADGWRPSSYACRTHANNPEKCPNKYVSDVTLGPFVFSLISNILKISPNAAKRMTVNELENRLLAGEPFENVEHIGKDGLKSLLAVLRSGETGIEYTPPSGETEYAELLNEHSVLSDRRRKDETALNRLHSLYLYSDSPMSETEYIVERQKIVDDMNEVDARLAELVKDDTMQMSIDKNEIARASYYVMIDQLTNSRTFDYAKYIKSMDPSIPKSFVNSVIEYIKVLDGHVTELCFKNNVILLFSYKK